MALRYCLLHLVKQSCLLKSYENCNLNDWGIFLPVSPSRSNVKLHNIHVTPNIGKKVMTDLDFSKASSPN